MIGRIRSLPDREQVEPPQGDYSTALAIPELPEHSLTDRCDACPSPVHAFVAVRQRRGNVRMDFCAHHYNQHASALAGHVTRVRDSRYLLGGRYAEPVQEG